MIYQSGIVFYLLSFGGQQVIILREFDNFSKNKARSWTLQYQKGAAIYFESDPNNYWYEVICGIVRTCRLHTDGHRQLTGFYYAGDVFGVDDGPIHIESAEAVTEATIRRHDRDSHDSATAQHAVALQRALDCARRCIFLFGHKTAGARVAAFLITMEERLDAGDGVAVPMSRTDIADHLGLTIHTVSRTISDLARQQLIALDGPKSIRIVDRWALCALAGLDPEDAPETHEIRIDARTGAPESR